MLHNKWLWVSPMYLVLIWTLARRYWILFVSHRRGKTAVRRILGIFTAVFMTVMLHLESHRGMVQSFRDGAGDPNGSGDLGYAIGATVIFLFVAGCYALVVYYGAKLIAKKRARKAMREYKAKRAQPITIVRPTKSEIESQLAKQLVMTLDASTVKGCSGIRFGSDLDTSYYELTIDCHWQASLEVSEAEVPVLLKILPRELRDQAEIEDSPESAA